MAREGVKFENALLYSMKASYAELKDEIHRIKRRISALEKAYDAITTRDDLQAINEAHEDFRTGVAVDLAEAKKSLGL